MNGTAPELDNWLEQKLAVKTFERVGPSVDPRRTWDNPRVGLSGNGGARHAPLCYRIRNKRPNARTITTLIMYTSTERDNTPPHSNGPPRMNVHGIHLHVVFFALAIA